MCQHILEMSNTDPTWLPNMWTSDEANFNLNGIEIELKLYFYDLLFRPGEYQELVCYAPKNGGRPDNFSVETVKHPDGVMVG